MVIYDRVSFDTHFNWKVQRFEYINVAIPGIIAKEYMPDYIGLSSNGPISKKKERINKKVMYDKLDDLTLENNKMLRFPWKLEFRKTRND